MMFIISMFLLSGEIKRNFVANLSHVSSYHFISRQSHQKTSAMSRRASGPVLVETCVFRD